MNKPILRITFLIVIFGLVARSADPPRRTIKIAGFGALTGPVQSFGINSRTAQKAAAEAINRNGGVRLADGAVANIEISYSDDRCNPDQAIALIRGVERSGAMAAIGPSCSSVAEPLFAALQHKVDDPNDNGIQMPIITDGATKASLARISEWAFRNVADEQSMYRTLWAWVRRQHPESKTVFGGEEGDFAHSHSTWQNIIRQTALDAGLTISGETQWSITDTQFGPAVVKMKSLKPEIVVLSSHPTTTCGVLKEMERQAFRPKLLVGLTSSASDDTLHQCGPLVEGLLIPTTFAPITPAAREAAAAVNAKGGVADLHSMAAWENVMMVKEVIERQGILAKPDDLPVDRRKLRDGLANLAEFNGLLGAIQRTPDRESHKPYIVVQVREGRWQPADGLITTVSGASRAPGLAHSREEDFRIAGDPQTLTLFLRHLQSADGAKRGPGRTVLFVHGATFPSALAAAFKFGGRSWMDELSEAGFDVWALDFPGYGNSTHYPEMDEPATAHDALGRAPECASQIARAVDFIRTHKGVERVSIIAHSWGSMAAGLFANRHPDRLDRLVFFGPIGIRHNPTPQRSPAWQYITSEYQWSRFQMEVPNGMQPVLPHSEYDPWIKAYLATDASSSGRTPPSVKVPSGPFADIAAAWSGSLPYDPSRITAPVLLVRGEWDSVSNAEDVAWLFHALSNASEKEAVTLDRGTHVMHLESGRTRLYKVVESFLREPVTTGL